MLHMPVPSPFTTIQKRNIQKTALHFEKAVVRIFNQQGETEQRYDKVVRAFPCAFAEILRGCWIQHKEYKHHHPTPSREQQ